MRTVAACMWTHTHSPSWLTWPTVTEYELDQYEPDEL